MLYKKIYTLYKATTSTPKERATAIYNTIHNNSILILRKIVKERQIIQDLVILVSRENRM